MLPFTENVRCARHYSKSFARSSSHKHFKVGIIIIPILEMGKFAQYYVSIKWWNGIWTQVCRLNLSFQSLSFKFMLSGSSISIAFTRVCCFPSLEVPPPPFWIIWTQYSFVLHCTNSKVSERHRSLWLSPRPRIKLRWDSLIGVRINLTHLGNQVKSGEIKQRREASSRSSLPYGRCVSAFM